MRIVLVCLIFASLLQAREISLAYLKEQPKSLQKDFLISLYLEQDITPEEADEAFSMLSRKKFSNFKKYVKKSNDKGAKEKMRCISIKELESLLDENATCTDLALNTSKILKGEKETLKKIAEKIRKKFPKRAEVIDILTSEDIFFSLLNGSKESFVSLMNGSGREFREKSFNKKIPHDIWRKFENDNWGFYQSIKLIVTNPKLDNLQRSLLGADLKNVSHKTLFFLAMNELEYENRDNAIIYLKRILTEEDEGFYRDRALFWQYLITKEKAILERLVKNSKLPNLYSIVAHEKLGIKPKYNIVFDLETKGERSGFDTKDPFFWVKYKEKILSENNATKRAKLIDALKFEDTIGHLSNILSKEEGYSKGYFVRPYEEQLKGKSNDKKALIYAIARQESLFIPTAVSTSYALGMMQVMPFNVDVIAKRMDEKIDYFNMFDPMHNIKYAEHIMDNLIKNFENPLFIAYAYNGGFGFAKRSIEKKHLFIKDEYEPYMSLELVDYDESRYYGKKVLANYAIYKSYYGEEINLTKILHDTITGEQPIKTATK